MSNNRHICKATFGETAPGGSSTIKGNNGTGGHRGGGVKNILMAVADRR